MPYPLPVPVLSALQYLIAHEMEINGPSGEPTPLTDAITNLAIFVAHVTDTDTDNLFDMIGQSTAPVMVKAHEFHNEPETMQ